MKTVKFINLIFENQHIGLVHKDFNIYMDLDKSEHTAQRQHRDDNEGGKIVTDDEIKKTIEAALGLIINQLIKNILNLGDMVLIKNVKSNLNLIIALKENNHHNFRVDCVVVTVMVKKNFKPKSGTSTIKVSV